MAGPGTALIATPRSVKWGITATVAEAWLLARFESPTSLRTVAVLESLGAIRSEGLPTRTVRVKVVLAPAATVPRSKVRVPIPLLVVGATLDETIVSAGLMRSETLTP